MLPQALGFGAKHRRDVGAEDVPGAAEKLRIELPRRPAGMPDEETKLVARFLSLEKLLEHAPVAAVVDALHDRLGIVGRRLAPEQDQESLEPHRAAEVELL